MSRAEVKPLRITAQLKNNRLIRAREAMGYDSAAEAARVLGLSHPLLCEFERLGRSPVSGQRKGEPRWSRTAVKIAVAYKTIPEYLWPEELEAVTGAVSSVEVDVPGAYLEPPHTPEACLESAEMTAMVVRCLDYLTPIEAKILRRRFGIGGTDEETLEEIGQSCSLSKERIRKLQERGIEKIQRMARDSEQFCTCGHISAVHYASRGLVGYACDNCECKDFTRRLDGLHT